MSWIYVQELEVLALRSGLGEEPSPIVKKTDSAKLFFCRECHSLALTWHPFGTTCELCEAGSSSARLTSSPVGFRVSHTAQLLEAETKKTLCSKSLSVSCEKFAQPSFSPRTSEIRQSERPATNSSKSATGSNTPQIQLPKWVRLILGDDTGPLPRPTAKANQHCISMRKWPSSRRYQKIFGTTKNPKVSEWLMGYPLGWSDPESWAMRWFQSKRGKRSAS